MIKLKPCPFCGHKPNVDDGDTIYPSGIYWRITNGVIHYIRHKERKEGDKPVFTMICNTIAGGCSMEIDDNSIEEVIEKWNSRVNDEIANLQAQIDTLMLEYCPDEMTEEQIDNWAQQQRPFKD